jgi:hypothetical protein
MSRYAGRKLPAVTQKNRQQFELLISATKRVALAFGFVAFLIGICLPAEAQMQLVPGVTTVAGNGTTGYSGDGGPATSAGLNRTEGVATDSAGNLYIADWQNNRIRKVDAGTGVITTVAGNGTAGFSGDGAAATSAMLKGPTGVVVDSAGNLYIADQANNRVRKVDGHVRTVPVPTWVKELVDRWMLAAKVTEGNVFRAVSRHGTAWGRGISENVVWYVVRQCALRLGLEHLAPHDLRRTCAKLCHVNGGELEQIQFLLGHASVLTTERYLGCKQNLEEPVNDRFGCLFSRTLDLR